MDDLLLQWVVVQTRTRKNSMVVATTVFTLVQFQLIHYVFFTITDHAEMLVIEAILTENGYEILILETVKNAER